MTSNEKAFVFSGIAVVAFALFSLSEWVTIRSQRAEIRHLRERPNRLQEIAGLKAENEQLQTEVGHLTAAAASTEGRSSVGSNDHFVSGALDHLKTLADLQKRKLMDISRTMPLLDKKGSLSPAFIELFALTPSEQENLKKAINLARQQVDNLAIANSTVSRTDDGGVVVAVKASTAGISIGDQLMDSIAAILGPDRNPSFLTLGASQIENSLDNFGAEDHTITLTPKPPGSKTPGYVLRDENDTAGGVSSDTTWISTLNDLPARDGVLLKLAPTGF
jgi:hypothetical protein